MMALAFFPVVAPLLAAALITGLDVRLPRRLADLIALLTSTAVAVVCIGLVAASRDHLLVYWFGAWPPRHGVALGISFAIDPLGAGLAALAALLVTAALVFSLTYFDSLGNRFHGLMLVFLAAMCGFTLTGDLFNLFVYFELMSVVAFALCGYKTEEATALEGSLNFAVTNTVAAFLVLLGIGLLYGHTGALNLAQIGRAIAGRPDRLVAIAFSLVAGGFMVKAAIAPFHFWLPDAHAVAPTPVCVLFSGVMVELGLYAIARLYWVVFAQSLSASAPLIRDVLIAVGAATALLGGVMAFLQPHIKRLLAFSTVAHAGLMLAGIALLDGAGLAGTAMYVLGHGLVKGALFFAAGMLLHRTGSIDERALRGAGRKVPAAGAIFVLGGLALAGLPPFATFTGERLILGQHPGYAGLAWLFAATSVLTAGAVFRVTARVFLGWGPEYEPKPAGTGQTDEEKPETAGGHDRTPWQMLVAPAMLMAMAIAAGLAGGLMHAAVEGAQRFVSSVGYWQRVLSDASPAFFPVASPAAARAEASRPVFAALAACGLATVSLRARSDVLPRLVRKGAGAVVLELRRAHSGRATDYVAWLMFGIGGLMVVFAWMA